MQRQPGNLTSLMAVKEKKHLLTHVKDGEADFIQEQRDRYRDRCNGSLKCGAEKLGSTPNTARASGNL